MHACRQSILVDKPDFKRSCWAGISDEAKEFVAQLLHKDPAKRPSAQQALKHAWLKGSVADRGAGKPLSLAVVQRIQVRPTVRIPPPQPPTITMHERFDKGSSCHSPRLLYGTSGREVPLCIFRTMVAPKQARCCHLQRYGQASELKRSVLESIADEMLGARAAPGHAAHGAEPDQAEAAVCRITAGATPVVTSPSDPPLQFLYRQLAFAEDGTVDRRQLSAALQRLGKHPGLCSQDSHQCWHAACRMHLHGAEVFAGSGGHVVHACMVMLCLPCIGCYYSLCRTSALLCRARSG